MSLVQLSLLGTAKLQKNGVLLHLERQKSFALLAYLAVTGEFVDRVRAATLLWPETAQANALSLLRHLLVDIRKNVSPELLLIKGRMLGLNRPLITTDFVTLHHLLKQANTFSPNSSHPDKAALPFLQQAVELFKGDFLADLNLSNSLPFEEWQTQQAQQLRQEISQALERLVSGYIDGHNYAQALLCAQQWVSLDPFREKAYYELMRLYAYHGQPSLALQQFEIYKRLITQQQGTQPQEDIIALARALRAGVTIARPVDLTPQILPSIPVNGFQPGQGPFQAGGGLASSRPMRALFTPEAWEPDRHLPCEGTPFLERPGIMAQILKSFEASSCRLLTLLGMSGVGKSRLALHLAHEMRAGQLSHPFQDRIFFISLDKCQRVEDVLRELVWAVSGRPYDPAFSLEPFISELRSQPILLILDNCEHLIKELQSVYELLHNAQFVKILATTRIRLTLPEAWCLDVGGLAYPQEEAPYSSLEKNLQFGAIQLFVQQAKRVKAEFSATQINIQSIVDICQVMDGLPLGIEAAAQAIRALSCDEISRTLTSGAWEQIFPRQPQHFLWASFERSWLLLTPEEQTALQRLSAVKGSFSQDAAFALGVSKNVLVSLSDQSWLRKNLQDRYFLPEALRQYAYGILAQNQDDLAIAHTLASTYYLTYLADLVPILKGRGQPTAIGQLEQDFMQIHAAWQWAVRHAQVRLWGPAMEGWGLYLDTRNQYLLAYETFTEALQSLPSEEPQNIYGPCASWLGQFCMILGKLEEAEKLFKISLSLARTGPDQEKVTRALLALGNLSALRHDLFEALHYYQELLSPEQQPKDLHEKVRSLNAQGAYALSNGAYHTAWHAYRESLEICFRLGDLRTAAFCFTNHGKLALTQQDYLRARLAFEQARGLYRLVKDKAGEATCLKSLGKLEMALGKLEVAQQYFEQGLVISRELNHYLLTRSILFSLGKALLHLGNPKVAHHIFQESLRMNLQIRATSSILTNLYYLTQLYHQHPDQFHDQPKHEELYQLVIYLLRHPLTKGEIKYQARTLLKKLQTQLDAHQKHHLQHNIQHVTLEMMTEMVIPKLTFF